MEMIYVVLCLYFYEINFFGYNMRIGQKCLEKPLKTSKIP